MAPRGPVVKHQGENNHKAKLDRHSVLTILERIEDGKGNDEIAREFGVNRKTIWRIRNGEGWKHLARSSKD